MIALAQLTSDMEVLSALPGLLIAQDSYGLIEEVASRQKIKKSINILKFEDHPFLRPYRDASLA